ncbi:uncharacterized protein At2g24330 [Nicotiana tabacum]|uniref:Uncharacterized protein At2g24330 n=2 Tax=Nicotiana TaxID=4085 RepID=A0A1S3YQC7_TOBAC|nr:PREDICTED: uncharacterized protein At2g24330-like [Nicotiana sylvestris]XP_016454414.1 PREDICTED: uncharacterized protein At2g24330-like [Nicotiana tabacum]
MAAESEKDLGDTAGTAPFTSTDNEEKTKEKKKKGLLSRIWNGLFGSHKDDFEKRLQHISKEEATVIARITRRSHRWRRMTRHLIILSVLFEVIAVAYAIMTTRSLALSWKMRAFRVLPMFLLPGLSFITYSALKSFTSMNERKDQKALERLRAERQVKIDELKEKSNYYTILQLIQRYDPDPESKAAAATVLASKLGTDTGLKVYLGDESKPNAPVGKSNDVEIVQSAGLRNRKQARSGSAESAVLYQPEGEMIHDVQLEGSSMNQHQQMVVDHYSPTGSSTQDGGWLARIAALLVGEDPTQSYALICGNCHMHNGLARKEDFSYVTYYCPHCNALNRPKQLDDHAFGSSTPNIASTIVVADADLVKQDGGSTEERISASSSPVVAASATTEGDKIVSSTSSS